MENEIGERGRLSMTATIERYCNINRIEKVIAVYGSSISTSSELSDTHIHPYLLSAVNEILISPGTLLVNGGYQGTMGSLARSVTEQGGLALGIRTSSINDTTVDDDYSQVVYASNHWERLSTLVEIASAYFVLPGGIGTLTEIASTLWTIDRSFTKSAPTIFIGSYWQTLLREFLASSLAFRNSVSPPIVFADQPEDIIRAIAETPGRYEWKSAS